MSFGELLRLYIQSSGHTIYEIAKLSGINRTTIQKILADKRKPTQEFMELIKSYLNLTPEELQKFDQAFELTTIGQSVFTQRQMICDMMKNLSEIRSLDSLYKVTSYQEEYTIKSQSITQGAGNVNLLILHSLRNLCLGKATTIYLNLPGTLSVTKTLLQHCIEQPDPLYDLKIYHITSLLKDPDNTPFPEINLNELSNLLPYILNCNLNYNLYYYYNAAPIWDSVNAAFPYYIIFPNFVILLNSSGNAAFVIKTENALIYFKNLFYAALNHTTLLTKTLMISPEILDNMLQQDTAPHPLNTLEFQPCLFTFLTDQMIYKYTNSKLPQYKTIIQKLLLRQKQLINQTSRICIFNKVGLEYFSNTGILNDFPAPYGLPLSVKDRISLLKIFYQHCKENRSIFRAANSIRFTPAPSNFVCTYRERHSVDFMNYNSPSNHIKYISIEEKTILRAFHDFFQYAVKSDLICSLEITLQYIEQCIDICKHLLP